MQQRRKADSNPQTSVPNAVKSQPPVMRASSKRNRKGSSNASTIVLLGIITLLVALISILSPATVNQAEQQVSDASNSLYKSAVEAELQLEKQFLNQQQADSNENNPPLFEAQPEHEHGDGNMKSKLDSMDASERMWRQPNQWVQGERNLKAALKELVALQQEGKELGVPILTRWLGPDFPAWPKKGSEYEEVEKWEAERNRRYLIMQKDESEWRDQMRAQYFTNNDGEDDGENKAEKE